MNKPTTFSAVAFLSLIFLELNTFSQPFVRKPEDWINPVYADWITMPGIDLTAFGVFYFRKGFEIDEIPEDFTIHISADNRYELFVNGQKVCFGPAVGDLQNWQYETINLSPFLIVGKNLLAAKVWNYGPQKGNKQLTHKTAFILQANSKQEQMVNTNSTWKVVQDNSFKPIKHTSEEVGGGYIAGATEKINGSRHIWGWQELTFDDSEWDCPLELGKGNHEGLNTWIETPWYLKPRQIPLMEQKKEKINRMVSIEGIAYQPNKFKGDWEIQIPANKKVEILLDHTFLTQGFPQLLVSGGNNATIKIQYQEKLFGADGKAGNRNEPKGKIMKGYYDLFTLDGKENRLYKPLWIRVFRFVKITIETKADALHIHDFHNLYTAYPFKRLGSINTQNDTLQAMLDICWRTARLCAFETYVDCPYYEQTQYIGDTRIQALISLYMANDDRLMKNAIRQFDQSRIPQGLTKSNHPSDNRQVIPPFSLLYVAMVHDYFMYRNDPGFIKSLLPGIRFTIDWFIPRIAENGLLGPLPYWNHVDGGAIGYKAGSPPGTTEGGSAHITLLLAYSLERAAEIFECFDMDCDADKYKKIAESLKQSVAEHCYDAGTGLFAETPKKQMFTQHTNAFAILTSLVVGDEAKKLAKEILHNQSLVQGTLYFQFYVFQAYKKAGCGDYVLTGLKKWKEFTDLGFTTFPEHGVESRSDCHAWSAHPLFHILYSNCGIEPAEPGFKSVRIEPNLGYLTKVSGSATHPLGMIDVDFTVKNRKIKAKVNLPKGLNGIFVWNGEELPLKLGINEFEIKNTN